MNWSRLFTSARAIGAASVLIAVGCERAKSSAAIDTSKVEQQTIVASSTPAQRGVVPESSPEAMRAFAAAHLRPGLKPGDFLTNKADYPTGDTADVFRAVLDTLYVSKDGFPGQVVLADEATPLMVTCARMPCPIIPPGTRSEPKLETLDAYRIATLNRRHITPNFKYHIPLTLLGEKGRREIEIDGRSIDVRDNAKAGNGMREVPFWLGFQATYPHAWGMAVLSAVGMNPQKNEAILQVSHRCGTYCHSTETMILWKVRGQWHVVERVPEEGDSTDLGNETLRYRGVGIHTPLHEIRESARRDSIRQAALPRDIHGRVTTRDGKPIPGTKIELHADANPNGVWMNISDALGNYRFDGVPVGGAGLTVRCPEASARPNAIAVVTATDVALGKSVEVNMTMERSACEDTSSVAEPQTIQPSVDAPKLPNEFDLARSRKSTYPSGEEAAIYRTLLYYIGAPTPAHTTLLYARTRTACNVSECDVRYRERIRYFPELMLSTLENFLTVRERQLDLKADFPGTVGITLIGDSAIAELERVTSRGNALDDVSIAQRAWPNVDRVVSFSAVGFSPHHKQAVVEMIRGTPATAELWVLNRTADGWKPARTFRVSKQ